MAIDIDCGIDRVDGAAVNRYFDVVGLLYDCGRQATESGPGLAVIIAAKQIAICPLIAA